jgi:hypothetical protein
VLPRRGGPVLGRRPRLPAPPVRPDKRRHVVGADRLRGAAPLGRAPGRAQDRAVRVRAGRRRARAARRSARSPSRRPLPRRSLRPPGKRFWVSTMRDPPDPKTRPGKLYRFDAEHRLRAMVSGLATGNASARMAGPCTTATATLRSRPSGRGISTPPTARSAIAGLRHHPRRRRPPGRRRGRCRRLLLGRRQRWLAADPLHPARSDRPHHPPAGAAADHAGVRRPRRRRSSHRPGSRAIGATFRRLTPLPRQAPTRRRVRSLSLSVGLRRRVLCAARGAASGSGARLRGCWFRAGRSRQRRRP